MDLSEQYSREYVVNKARAGVATAMSAAGSLDVLGGPEDQAAI
jgi:hypothetical protein